MRKRVTRGGLIYDTLSVGARFAAENLMKLGLFNFHLISDGGGAYPGKQNFKSSHCRYQLLSPFARKCTYSHPTELITPFPACRPINTRFPRACAHTHARSCLQAVRDRVMLRTCKLLLLCILFNVYVCAVYFEICSPVNMEAWH